MAGSNVDDFNRRLKQYKKGSKGGLPLIGRRGVRAVSGSRSGLRMPWFSTLLVLTLVFLLKAFIVLRIGEGEYRQRLAVYNDPGLGERIGLYVMRPDPVTLKLRDFARPLIGR